MNELQQVLNDIKQDKNTNLLPGNLRDNVTCLGVEGTAEVPETIYKPSSYYYDSLVINDKVYSALYVDDWFIYAIKDSNAIVCYYNNNKVCQFNRTRTDDVRISCMKLGTDYIIIIITQWNQRDNLVYKININGQVSQLNSINVNTYYSDNHFTRDGDLSIDGDLYRYDEDTDKLVSKYSLSRVLNANFRGLNNFLYDNLHNNDSSYNTITKYTYNSDYNTYSVLQAKVLDVDGVTYNGDKIVKAGNIYQLGSNLEVGSLLKSNVLPHLDGNSGPVINWIDSSMCEYNGVIYNFDDDTNTFTLADDLPMHTQYVVNSAAYLYFKYNNTYTLLKTEYSDVEVGYNYKGNYFPKSNIVFNSGNILQGNTYYTDVLQPVAGTMPNNGELNITPTTENQNIPEGYTSGGTVLGDENLKSENIKKDVSIFGVTGSLESGSGQIKLFETVEEMQADSSSQEGDLAIVYREEIQNMTADTQTQYITFPETITLPEAFTDSVYGRLRAVDTGSKFDAQVRLDRTSFSFDGGSTVFTRVRVEYTSIDGITYTRTRFSGVLGGELTNPVDLGAVVKYEPMEPWNDALGYFMQVNGHTFDGLYTCDNVVVDYTYPVYNFDTDSVEEYVSLPKEVVDLRPTFIIPSKIEDGTLKSGTIYIGTSTFYKLSDIGWVGTILTYSSATGDVNKYELTDSVLSEKQTLTANKQIAGNASNSNRYLSITPNGFSKITKIILGFDKLFIGYDYGTTRSTECPIVPGKEYGTDSISASFSSNAYKKQDVTELKYVFAETQLTLNNASQLLPGIIGYGKNGIATGDGSIYDVLNETTLLKTVTGIDGTDVNAYGYIGDVFSRLVYLTKQSKGKYVLGRTEVNDKPWRYQSKDGSVVCEWLSVSDFTVKKDGELVFQLSNNADKGYNWASNSSNEVFYVDDDRLAILNRRSNVTSSVGSGLNIFKVNMHTGETTLMATDDFFTVPSTNYTNIESGSSKYGLAFITAGIVKRDSPYNNYSGVKFYDAVYDKVAVIEDTQATSNDDNLSYICPLLASTNDPRYLLICTRCYTTSNNRTTKLYRYDRETGEKELINTYNSNINIGTSNGYNLGMTYETTDYIYVENDQTHMYRFAKKSSYSLDQYTTDAAKIAYSINHRLLNSDVYDYSEGVIYRFTSTNNEPKFEVVDTLNLSSNRASVNGESYGPLYATIITDDTVKTIDTMYSKNSAMELQRYELSDKYNADTIAVNTSHSSTMHTTFVLTKDNDSAPITQEQYNTAVETSKQILGVKEEVQ